MQLPGTDQINALGQVPAIILALAAVIMAIFMLILFVRSLAGRQASQDKNMSAIVELLGSKDKQIVTMDTNYEVLSEARKSQAESSVMQAKSYEILVVALNDSITKLPAAVATATIETFLLPFKEYTKGQTDLIEKVVLAQTEIITKFMMADSEKTLGMLGQIRDEVNKRLDIIESLSRSTEATVGRAEDRAVSPTAVPLTAADIGAEIAKQHAPSLTAADIGREVASQIANNTPPTPEAPPNTGGGGVGTVKARLNIPDQDIEANITPDE